MTPATHAPHANGPVGRLAPSPTGLPHLGNAWAFFLAWLDIRVRGGRVLLRMEDIDPARSRAVFAAAIREDLAWLGLDWDEETPPQSTRAALYEQALAALERQGVLYPCFCTRAELRALAGAPHVDDAGAPYPGACRRLGDEERAASLAAGKKYALRLACPPDRADRADTIWHFEDAVQGAQAFTLAQVGGDFALRRSDGVYAYQLAATVDDLSTGVTRIVRGRDILPSTPRQLYLRQLLRGSGLPGVPRTPAASMDLTFAHLPLLLDHQGERLAKRHASLTLRTLREAEVRAEAVIGYLAHLAGFLETARPLSAKELAAQELARRAGGAGLGRLRPEDRMLPEDMLGELLRVR